MGYSVVPISCALPAISQYAPSQWDTSLHCNDASHWLGAYLDWSLLYILKTPLINKCHIFSYFPLQKHPVTAYFQCHSSQRFWWGEYSMLYSKFLVSLKCVITHGRDRSRYAPSQWETLLQCNNVFHWLGTYLGWSMLMVIGITARLYHNGVMYSKMYMSWEIYMSWKMSCKMYMLCKMYDWVMSSWIVSEMWPMFISCLVFNSPSLVSNTCISGLGQHWFRRQAITWTNAGLLSIRPLGTNFSEIWIEIQNFSFMEIHLKMLSAKLAAILSRGRWVNSLWPSDAILCRGPVLTYRQGLVSIGIQLSHKSWLHVSAIFTCSTCKILHFSRLFR